MSLSVNKWEAQTQGYTLSHQLTTAKMEIVSWTASLIDTIFSPRKQPASERRCPQGTDTYGYTEDGWGRWRPLCLAPLNIEDMEDVVNMGLHVTSIAILLLFITWQVLNSRGLRHRMAAMLVRYDQSSQDVAILGRTEANAAAANTDRLAALERMVTQAIDRLERVIAHATQQQAAKADAAAAAMASSHAMILDRVDRLFSAGAVLMEDVRNNTRQPPPHRPSASAAYSTPVTLQPQGFAGYPGLSTVFTMPMPLALPAPPPAAAAPGGPPNAAAAGGNPV